MNYDKTAQIIKQLRLQKNLTQSMLAQKLHITEQAVSKWERALGLPDITTCHELAQLLGVSVEVILSGNLDENEEKDSNMKNTIYYVCPMCGNLITSQKALTVSCCGRALLPVEACKATDTQKMHTEKIEDSLYITTDHAMTKSDYIMFTAFVTSEKLELTKHFPEWNLELRIPSYCHGKLLWYSKKEGLLYQLI